MKYNEIVNPLSNQSFKNWFGNSKVVDMRGNPMVMYHGTDAHFETFHPWSHFGTSIAANDRLDFHYKKEQENLKLIPVYLKIENPLLVDDKESDDEACLFNSLLRTVTYEAIIDRENLWSPEILERIKQGLTQRIKKYRLDEIDFDFAKKFVEATYKKLVKKYG